MAQFLNPFSGTPFLDANGDPYVGAQLFTYIETSSTKVTVTKDEAGLSNHTNPIILNARGFPGDGAGAAQAIWQPSGTTIKLVLAPSTDTDPPTTPIDTWDNLAGINDAVGAAQGQWETGPEPTFVNTTSFTLIGDQTTDFHIGRRVRTINSSGTIYSTIINSAFTSLTTVTVINDSGVLDVGLSDVFYGLLTATDHSSSSDAFIPILGPDIASAAALPYPAYGNYSDVTGTTDITSIDTSGAIGTVIKRHFDGILKLTHHATNLILPGGVNIITAAGDESEFVEYGSGTWRCTNYQKAEWIPTDYSSGLLMDHGTDTAKDIDITVGEATDSTNTVLLKLTSAVTKELDASYVSGTGGGVSSSLHPLSAANHVVYIHLIKIGTVVDIGYDTSITAANLITDHSVEEYRVLGAFNTDETPDIMSGHIVHFHRKEVGQHIETLFVDDNATGIATVDFLTGFGLGFKSYNVVWRVNGTSALTSLNCRVSTNGSTFISTASYGGGLTEMVLSGVDITNDLGNFEGADGIFHAYNMSNINQNKRFRNTGVNSDAGGSAIVIDVAGQANTATSPILGLQFYMSAGNLRRGYFSLYGID